MKVRFTPLNLVVSALLVSVAYLIIFKDESGFRILGTIPLLALVIVCFISDLLFRKYLKDLKRIWIVELVFIIFAATILILIQKG